MMRLIRAFWSTVVVAALLTAAAALQYRLPALAATGRMKYPFLAVAVLYVALHRSMRAALATGLAAGLIQDGLGLGPFGLSSLTFMVFAAAMALLRDVVDQESLLAQSFFGGLAGLVCGGLHFGLLRLEQAAAWAGGMVLLRLLSAAAAGAAIGPLLFGCFRVVDINLGILRRPHRAEYQA